MGNRLNIPVLPKIYDVVTEQVKRADDWMSVLFRGWSVGKSADGILEKRQGERKGTDGVARGFQEITARRQWQPYQNRHRWVG